MKGPVVLKMPFTLKVSGNFCRPFPTAAAHNNGYSPSILFAAGPGCRCSKAADPPLPRARFRWSAASTLPRSPPSHAAPFAWHDRAGEICGEALRKQGGTTTRRPTKARVPRHSRPSQSSPLQSAPREPCIGRAGGARSVRCRGRGLGLRSAVPGAFPVHSGPWPAGWRGRARRHLQEPPTERPAEPSGRSAGCRRAGPCALLPGCGCRCAQQHLSSSLHVPSPPPGAAQNGSTLPGRAVPCPPLPGDSSPSCRCWTPDSSLSPSS